MGNPFQRRAFKPPPPPHAAGEVDWSYATAVESRAMDQTGRANTPLGDGTRWGATEAIHVTGPSPAATSQFIRVQTVDPYARNWQMIGTVGAFQELWDLSAASFQLALEVTMGAGQGTVFHVFDLRALIDLADPWYTSRVNNETVVRPWAIAGGIIGRNINTRLVVTIPPLGVGVTFNVDVSAIISPYAAGSGI